MESGDGGASSPHEPGYRNTETTLASPSTISTAHPEASPPPPISSHPADLPALEAADDPTADRLWQHPSSAPAMVSADSPRKDLSSLRDSPSAQAEPIELYCRGVSSSDQPLNRASGDEFTDEKAHHSMHEASPLHPQSDLLVSEAPSELLWRDPSVQVGPHESSSSHEELRAEELLPSTSADQFSHTNRLQQLPLTMPTYDLPHEASMGEEFHYPSQEQELPDDVKREKLAELCKGVSILSCKSEAPGGYCNVYLIGTAHVSEESCKEVRAATSFMRPEVVFLELCEKRTYILRRTHCSVPTVSDMLAMWKEKRSNMLGIFYSWFVAKVAAKLDVFPGSEFRAAYEEAIACGAKVVLGDRDIEVTLKRTWGKMSMWHKTKFISSMVLQALFLPKADQLNELVEKLQDADILTLAFEELGRSFPTVMETVIDERDMFMTAVLQKIAEHHSSVVAVVGRGHVAGITKYWGQDIQIHTLLEIPRKKSIWNATTKFNVLAALVALTSTLVFVYYGAGYRQLSMPLMLSSQ